MMYAAECGKVDVAELLIKKGADKDAKDNFHVSGRLAGCWGRRREGGQ